jgi:hypothetical protein
LTAALGMQCQAKVTLAHSHASAQQPLTNAVQRQATTTLSHTRAVTTHRPTLTSPIIACHQHRHARDHSHRHPQALCRKFENDRNRCELDVFCFQMHVVTCVTNLRLLHSRDRHCVRSEAQVLCRNDQPLRARRLDDQQHHRPLHFKHRHWPVQVSRCCAASVVPQPASFNRPSYGRHAHRAHWLRRHCTWPQPPQLLGNPWTAAAPARFSYTCSPQRREDWTRRGAAVRVQRRSWIMPNAAGDVLPVAKRAVHRHHCGVASDQHFGMAVVLVQPYASLWVGQKKADSNRIQRQPRSAQQPRAVITPWNPRFAQR